MLTHKLTSVADVVRFITGGKALFTIRSLKTGRRFTYRVSLSRQRIDSLLVSLVNGTQGFTYIGQIKTDGANLRFVRTVRSQLLFDAPEVTALRFLVEQLSKIELHPDLEVWHEGRCGACGRVLIVPESIARGIGPECWSKRYFQYQTTKGAAA